MCIWSTPVEPAFPDTVGGTESRSCPGGCVSCGICRHSGGAAAEGGERTQGGPAEEASEPGTGLRALL
jgi:hypothetical protein